MPEETQNLLTEVQRQAVQAMATSGMPLSAIADALCVPVEYLEGHSSEWRVGRMEALRVSRIEADIIGTPRTHRGLAAKKRAFLAAFEVNGGNVSAAADAAGCERGLHYRWLAGDPEYKRQFELAVERAADVLEDEAIRRAKGGVLEPLFNRAGNLIGHKIRYSDQLLLASLAARRPDRWKQRNQTEIVGAGEDGAVKTKLEVVFVGAQKQ
jgi:hypothetical protein